MSRSPYLPSAVGFSLVVAVMLLLSLGGYLDSSAQKIEEKNDRQGHEAISLGVDIRRRAPDGAPITLSGPEEGKVNIEYAFTALLEPISPTLPLTYTWTASEQAPVSHVSSQLSDTISYTWSITGLKTLMVVAESVSQTLTATHQIELSKHFVYLPLIAKDFCGGYFDDFHDPSSGWWVGNTAYNLAQYLNGEYRVVVKSLQSAFGFRAPSNCMPNNYSLEVDVRWASTPGMSYGLLFDLNDDFTTYMMFGVNTDYQLFSLYKIYSGGYTEIVYPSYNPAIHTGTSSNHLKVERIGTQARLTINGVSGPWYNLYQTNSGDVGVMASTYQNYGNADARFDNFRVEYLSALTTLAGQEAPPAPASDQPHLDPDFVLGFIQHLTRPMMIR